MPTPTDRIQIRPKDQMWTSHLCEMLETLPDTVLHRSMAQLFLQTYCTLAFGGVEDSPEWLVDLVRKAQQNPTQETAEAFRERLYFMRT